MSCLKRVSVGVALSLILPLTSLSGASSSPTTRASTVGREMDKLVAAGAPGVIVLFREGDQVISLARGWADVARKMPMRSTDRFRIASLTKSYDGTPVLWDCLGSRRGLRRLSNYYVEQPGR